MPTETPEKKETELSATPDTQTKPEVKAEKAPTPEEIEARAKEAMKDWFGNEEKAPRPEIKFPAEPPEKKEEKPDESKKEEAAESKKEEEAKPEPKEKKKAKAKAEPAEEIPAKLFNEDEAEVIAERVLEKIEGKKPEPKKGEVTDRFAGATRVERMKLEALEHIAKTWEDYKGRDLAGETLAFWKAEGDYISAWRKDHPGEEFDAQSEDHRQFYKENEPKVRDDEIVLARTEMSEQRTNSKVEESRKEQEQFRREKEAEKAIAKAAPLIETSAANATLELIKSIPGFDKIVEAAGLTKESIQELEETNPAAFGFLDAEAPGLKLAIAELEKMRNLGQHYEAYQIGSVKLPSGAKINPQAEVLETALDLEQSIVALPADQQIASGRRFVTRDERSQRVQAIINSEATDLQKKSRLKALNERFWTIDHDDVRAALIEKSSRRVKGQLEIASKTQKVKPANNGHEQETPTKKEVETKPARVASKPVASMAAESDIVTTRVPGHRDVGENLKKVESEWF